MSDPDAIFYIFRDFASKERVTKYAFSASATMIIWDHLASLDQEIDFVWRKEWSVIKLVFLWHRYMGLMCAFIELAKVVITQSMTQSFCAFWFRWELWVYCSIVFTTEVVLALWIYVIYNKNRWMLNAIGCTLLAQVISVVIILAKSFNTLQPWILPVLQICSALNVPAFFKSVWIPVLIYNSIILALFLYRAVYVYSFTRKGTGRHSSILANLFFYSLAYFLAVFATYLICAVLWLTVDLGLAEIPVAFVLSSSTIASTRLLLNIRHAYYTEIEPTAAPDLIVDASGPMAGSGPKYDEPEDFLNMADGRRSKNSRRTTIYAEDADREQWAIQLREIRWAGFD